MFSLLIKDKKLIDNYLNQLPMEKYEQFENFLMSAYGKKSVADLTDEEYHKLAIQVSKAK